MVNAEPEENPQVGTHGYVCRYRIRIDFEHSAEEPTYRGNAGQV